jgi:two-component system sensor histidine kinase KdpD
MPDTMTELYTISRAISQARTPDAVLTALRLNRNLRECHRAAIGLFNHPWDDAAPPEHMDVLAEWRVAVDPPSPTSAGFALGIDWLVKVRVSAHAGVAQDVEQDASLSESARAQLRAQRMSSYALFPLVVDGVWYGVLVFYFTKPGAITAPELAHVQELVDQAAVAIDNQRLLEAEVRARIAAEEASRTRLQYLAMISHELRAPLSAIKGFITTLLTKDVEWDLATQHDFMSIIDMEADKLTKLVDELLDFSRMDAGRLRVMPEVQTLHDILARATPQLSMLTQNYNLMLDIPPDLPAVMADRQRIAQVLTNLVDNAVKYTPRHTNIRISAMPEGDYVRVDASDEGPGIAPEEETQLFQPFYRGNDSLVHQTKGAGLGLAICKGLVEAHGGKIWLQSHKGPGTTISFTLPIAS